MAGSGQLPQVPAGAKPGSTLLVDVGRGYAVPTLARGGEGGMVQGSGAGGRKETPEQIGVAKQVGRFASAKPQAPLEGIPKCQCFSRPTLRWTLGIQKCKSRGP